KIGMRLLVITQKIDRKDPVLGFVHRWLEEFSKRIETITVVCLQKGDYDLPGNVAVLSLGKEKWKSTAKYVFLLFYFSIRYANRYDAVLVHMNQEYILAAGWLWRLFGKKVYMWRNHYAGSMLTDIASVFCNKIFCTSHYSYTAKYEKTRFMPVGVDTEFFKPESTTKRVPRSILSLGRISSSKNINTLVSALEILKKDNVSFSADIYGNPTDQVYADSLREQVRTAGLLSYVRFLAGVPNLDTPRVYSAHQIFVNLSPNGMYDKTIFEAMACGCFVFASNDDLRDKIDPSFSFAYNDAADLAGKLKLFMAMTEVEKKRKAENIAALVNHHSLIRLSEEITNEIK
ncbi:MAG: glycosyltransferase, partial [Candidatus Taylorbacteria bacterium]|nr:glycosyltransferase [Candidatus Taylorbacteria bacterium]